MSEFFVENTRKLCEDVTNLIAFIENNPPIRQVGTYEDERAIPAD